MSVEQSKFAAKYSAWKQASFCVPALTLLFCASNALAAAPAVVITSQQTIGTGYNSPQSVATNYTNKRAVFIADTANNRIVALVDGTNYIVQPNGFTLSSPQALALDNAGDLFVGDTPTVNGQSVGRVIEMTADHTGNLTGAATLLASGAPLTNPIALAVDTTGTLFIGDYNVAANPTVGSIFSLAAGASTPTLLNITGLPSGFIPAALVRDSAQNLYFADNGSMNGGIYLAPDTGGAAQPVATQSFIINQPSGLALDPAGNLYILSLLGSGSGLNPGQQVVVIPAASPTTPYIIPNLGLTTSSSMALDPDGNLDIAESITAGTVVQLSFDTAANLGHVVVGQTGSPIQFNFEFNQPTTLAGFGTVTQGDTATEVLQSGGGDCSNGTLFDIPGTSTPITPYTPYTCANSFQGQPLFPGIRSSAIQVKGSGSSILAAMPVYQTGFAGAEITYPLTATTTVTNLQQPQALALSGQNKTLYIADTLAGVVYSTPGPAGTTLTPVSTGTIVLQAPSALALDGAGDLFIADFNLAEVIEVPANTAIQPSVLNIPAGLLQHPIALAIDYLGNMYIGDAGSGGVNASSSNPGYVVKVPILGAPFILPIPSGISIVFPQALTTDPYTADLLIGDGGDPSGVGKIVQVYDGGFSAGTGPVAGVTNPTGLAFDAADDLYVLDGTANTVTAIPGVGDGSPFAVPFVNNGTPLASASALAISAGGQSFVIGNIGTGNTNGLLYVNGNASTLNFGSVGVGSQSQPMTATELNIGNDLLTLQTPYFTTNGANANFSILGTSTCSNGLVISYSASCTINAQFTPIGSGLTAQQIVVGSNAYNSNVPILTLQGTGTGSGTVKPAATPSFAPATGTSFNSTMSVSIQDTTPGATIHYTTNGSPATTSSPVYSTPFTISASTVVNAIAAKTGFAPSPLGTAIYTFTGGGSTDGIVSDNFDEKALNTSLWTLENPLGDGIVTMNGSAATLNVPMGKTHDLWTTGNDAVRIMQPVANGNFSVDVRFQSAVEIGNQDEGILVEQANGNFLRFDVLFNGTTGPELFAAGISGGTGTVFVRSPISLAKGPLVLRLARTGNVWTGSYSTNGTSFTTAQSFTFDLTVARVGPYAGTYAASAVNSPSFTAIVDYFFATSSPIANQDGPLPYGYATVDANPPGTLVEKTLADIQGTGKLEPVVGFEQYSTDGNNSNGGIYWYSYPTSGGVQGTWARHAIIADGNAYEDMAPLDVNGDGAVDIVASYNNTSGVYQIVWFENPRGSGGDPTKPWVQHKIGPGFGENNLEIADIDGDGKLDVVTPSSVFFQNNANSWTQVKYSGSFRGVALLDIGSGKGAINLAGTGPSPSYNVVWYENPRETGGNARTGKWIMHYIGPTPYPCGKNNCQDGGDVAAYNAMDVNGDKKMDVISGQSEGPLGVAPPPGGLEWWQAPTDRRNGTWIKHTIDANMIDVHKIAIGDMNLDGHLDIIVAEQDQSPLRRVVVYYDDGNGNLTPQIVSNAEGHNICVGDVTHSGTLDMLNSGHGYFLNSHPLQIFLNPY